MPTLTPRQRKDLAAAEDLKGRDDSGAVSRVIKDDASRGTNNSASHVTKDTGSRMILKKDNNKHTFCVN